MLLILLFRIS